MPRSAIGAFAICAAVFLGGEASAQDSTPSSNIVVTLLGTGTPTINIRRFGYANPVQAREAREVFLI